jgi:quercetin dioxygenase-like cupin family protein
MALAHRHAIITRAGEGTAHAHAGGAVSFTTLSAAQSLSGETSKDGVAVQMGQMPEGSGPPFHRHPDFDEVFIIVEGVVEFQVNDELHTAHAGDMVFVPGEVPHAPRCIKGNDNGVARIIMLVTPARYENFFHELGELIASGNANHDAIATLGANYSIEFLERPAVRIHHDATQPNSSSV